MTQGLPSTDLRTALEMLKDSGELDVITAPVDPHLELARRYAAYAGVPSGRPTAPGPAMLFTDVGERHQSVVLGVFGDRQRTARYLGAQSPSAVHALLRHAVQAPLQSAPGATRVPRHPWGSDVGVMPIPTITSSDAGPYVTMGLVLAEHPDSGIRNVSVHRICVRGSDQLTIWIVPGRDLGRIAQEVWDSGRGLPVSINIGLDPALYLASGLTGRAAGYAVDELEIAGALRGAPVSIAPPRPGRAPFVEHAEWVVHGTLTPGPVPESEVSGGGSMPEFLGYSGLAHPGLPVIIVDEVTSRSEPVFQTVVGPGLEQSLILGFGMEVDVLMRLADRGIEWVTNAHATTAGGGQLLIFLAVDPPDERSLKATVACCRDLLEEMRMVKTIVLVNSDVDLDDHGDMWWAVTTRVAPSTDVLVIADAPGFPLDPSQRPDGTPGSPGPGRTSKLLINAIAPPAQRQRFERVRLGY